MRKKTFFSFLLICVFAASSCFASPSNPENKKRDGILRLFDLKNFLSQFEDTKVQYDYLKLASALQGLVNRDKPQIYYFYESNSIAEAAGMDMDRYWFDQLNGDGQYLSSFAKVHETDFFRLLEVFKNEIRGIVLWDENVPATANVAATVAGADKLLPVRYDETPGSVYDEVVVKRNLLPVKLNLVGKFTGQGTIDGTNMPSTGSAKNDAYLWAKFHYLDKGLTNPVLMEYALDAFSWDKSGGQYNAKMYSAYIPQKMKAGQELAVSVTVENTGETAWSLETNDRLGSGMTNEFIWNDLHGGYSNHPGDQRVFLDAGERIEPGQRKTFTFTLIAPDTPGEYTFNARMVRDGVTWMGDSLNRTVEVTAEDVPPEDPAEKVIAGGSFRYPDLFNSFLPNADYYIANKAFFFDLSPDRTIAPIDDRGQPVGTDYNTLIELLRAQNQRAGKQIITIGGFVPWFLKYTTAADSASRLEPVAAEWGYLDIISKYNAQKDADAYGLIGLANASVFQHVPLKKQFKQNNDKGKNGKRLESDKKYVVFYMGDYDGGAWFSGALPALWNDPKRGDLPLAWSHVPGLSKRVPHVFNYIYDTMTPNDYFVSGDNGAGYLNPMMLLEENRPDGLPPFLNIWEQYNRKYYRQFDLDITGFLISGNSGSVNREVQEAYSRISPVGVGNNNGFEEPVVKGTPFVHVVDLGIQEQNAEEYGKRLAGMLQGDKQFHMFRVILTRPGVLVDAVRYVKENYPDQRFEVVDPYTFFRLYKNSLGNN